jgi:hypothetical protein
LIFGDFLAHELAMWLKSNFESPVSIGTGSTADQAAKLDISWNK